MYDSSAGFSLSLSLNENKKRRSVQQRRQQLAKLNLKQGSIIKTCNGVETVCGFDEFAHIKTTAGKHYKPTEIRKVG